MPHVPTRRVIAGVAVGVAAIQALLVFMFVWPPSDAGPRELPLAVAGPPEAVGEIEGALSSVPGPDDDTPAFDVTAFDSEDAARDAIADREVYGALVVTPEGPSLLVASGASPAVAQLLERAAGGLAGDAPLAIDDVAPANDDDPNGVGLASGLLPLILTSVAGGLAAGFLLRGAVPRLVAISGLSIVGGLSAGGLLYGLGIADESYLAVAGVTALVIGAAAGSVAGLAALLGRSGAILGVLLLIFVGNPLSAAASAPELLPQPWGDVGQFLPPGAAVSTVRSVEFFDGAAIGGPLLTLVAWLVVGASLVVAAAFVRRGADEPAD